MSRRLEPCPRCARHVRSDVRTCPFCDARVAFAGAPERPMPTTRLCRSALMSFTAVAVSVGCGPVDPGRAQDADVSMDGSAGLDAARDARPSIDSMEDPNCYGPDTGYGTPPFGWCCNADCCHAPLNWFACPGPSDAGSDGGDVGSDAGDGGSDAAP